MRLIDADELYKRIKDMPASALWHDVSKEGVLAAICEAPTINEDQIVDTRCPSCGWKLYGANKNDLRVCPMCNTKFVVR